MSNINFNQKFHPKIHLLYKTYISDIFFRIPLLALVFSPIIVIFFMAQHYGFFKNQLEMMVLITLIIIILIFLFIIFYRYAFFKTIEYEILDNEIHVYQGIFTKTKEIVPYRTITNIAIKISILDRLLGIGTIEIQTAGTRGRSTEKIMGLSINELPKIEDMMINKVRKIRGSPGTSHDLDMSEDDHLSISLMQELKEMKEILQQGLK